MYRAKSVVPSYVGPPEPPGFFKFSAQSQTEHNTSYIQEDPIKAINNSTSYASPLDPREARYFAPGKQF